MNNQFLPYEQAFDLKELGFNEECLATYIRHENRDFRFDIQEQSGIRWHSVKNSEFEGGEHCAIPLYQQAFRWFREKYQLYAWIKVEYEYGGVTPTFYITGKRQEDIAGGAFETFEEAELACLKKLIEIVKNKK